MLYSNTSSSQCGGTAKNSIVVSDLGNGPGVVAWTNPANAIGSDNVRTSASWTVSPGSPLMTHYLSLRNFNFSIPSNATICGIDVVIEHRKKGGINGGNVTDYSIQLTNGTYTSANYARAINWKDTDEVFVYGSDIDTWGVNWVPSDLCQSSFGVNITAKLTAGTTTTTVGAEIDNIYMTIYSSNVLPIELLAFNAKPARQKVDLSWITATETNNDHFVVERSKDAINFSEVLEVKGAGNSSMQLSYIATDEHPYPGLSYYRLKQVDRNGSSTTFPITEVSVHPDHGMQVISQPGLLLVNVNCQQSDLVDVTLEDMQGQTIWHTQQNASEMNAEIKIDVAGIANGIYFVKARSNSAEYCTKAFLLKE